MAKKAHIALLVALVLVGVLAVGVVVTGAATKEKQQCKDSKDNDADGLIDSADPGCNGLNDNDEYNKVVTECEDAVDNDGDGLIDLSDLGCADAADNNEANCGDAICQGDESAESCAASCSNLM